MNNQFGLHLRRPTVIPQVNRRSSPSLKLPQECQNGTWSNFPIDLPIAASPVIPALALALIITNECHVRIYLNSNSYSMSIDEFQGMDSTFPFTPTYEHYVSRELGIYM